MKPFFRFGQPIGTALTILAFVDTIYSTFWLLLDFVSLKHISQFNFFSESSDFEFWGHLQWHFLLALHFVMSCIFWISVIFEGRKYYLYVWLIISFIHNALFVTNIISQAIIHPEVSDTSKILLYVSLGFFIIWRCYTMSVACQGLRRLRNKYNLNSDSVSDMDICLEPLGSGCYQTWEFFKDLPGVGAITMLTVELIWNIVNLCTRPFVAKMFGFGVLEMPLEYLEGIVDFLMVEETGVRVARIVLGCICMYFLHKENLSVVRVWVCFYFLLFVISNMTNAFMIAHWWTVVPELGTIIYHIFVLTCDNVFRIVVLYFTIKYGMVHIRTIAKL